jgi:hypothetical protein
MRRFFKEVTVAVLILSMTFGCAGPGGSNISNKLQGTACMAMYTVGGAAAGAAVGAAVGAIADGEDGAKKGAVIGAAGGAIAGFAYAWGRCFEHFSSVKSEPVLDCKAVQYNSANGTELKINNYTANPSIIAPGDMMTLNLDYFVFTPGQKEVLVTETRILKFRESPQTGEYKETGRVSETITAGNGCRHAHGQFVIPSDTPEGNYMIEVSIASEGKPDSVSIPIMLTNKPELLAQSRPISKGKAIKGATANTYASDGIKTISEGKIVTVVIEKATLRRGPDKGSTKIASVKRGDQFEFIKEETIAGKKWYEVRLENGDTAWIIANTSKLTEE